MFPFPSFTKIVCCIFVAYIAHSTWTIYTLFHPAPCPPTSLCLKPYLATIPPPKLELYIYTATSKKIGLNVKLDLLHKFEDFRVHEPFEKVLKVSIPKKTRDNGTLYTHVFTCPVGESPIANSWTSYATSELTAYSVLATETYKLVGNTDDENQDAKKKDTKASPGDQPVTHWRSKLTINLMDEIIYLDRWNVPGDIARFIKLSPENEVLPILYIDQLSNRIKDLVPVNKTSKKLELTIKYQPISIGMLRMWSNIQEAMKMLRDLGFSEKDTDEVKGIFADTSLYLLLTTFLVAAFHLLFDFLAFKNDISYWKKRDTMVGLSTRTVVWRCISTFIIFMYLFDQETSLLVLIPAGIGTIIELWKVTKAFKVKVLWSGWTPSFQMGHASDKEKETQQFDSQAMKYLSYLLYPLVLGGAVYSLLYTPHKSWYSWCVQSLVNGVYAFGFLFMLPQLFVNYKLKSVAHLPWRAFMYKAFNTFIDDIFAFIITMPTAHRVACFRDDIVFLVYLYQRWLYPVDKTRVNEYGQSFDEDKGATADATETKKTK